MVSNYDNERNRPQNIYTNDNNNSEGKDPYWNSKDKKNNNYDSKYRILFIKKEKEYNNLLRDYNDLVVKYMSRKAK